MKNSDQTEVWTKIAKLFAMLRETMAAQLKTTWNDKFTKVAHVVVNNDLVRNRRKPNLFRISVLLVYKHAPAFIKCLK